MEGFSTSSLRYQGESRSTSDSSCRKGYTSCHLGSSVFSEDTNVVVMGGLLTAAVGFTRYPVQVPQHMWIFAHLQTCNSKRSIVEADCGQPFEAHPLHFEYLDYLQQPTKFRLCCYCNSVTPPKKILGALLTVSSPPSIARRNMPMRSS